MTDGDVRFPRNSTAWTDWDSAFLAGSKGGRRISVVLPARNEATTIGPIVTLIRNALVERVPLVDEVVVLDSDSTDDTAAIAAASGATVFSAADVRPDLGRFAGKGEALWKSQFVTVGDILVFVDADLTEWGPHFVTGLVGPLLAREDVLLVKGFYERILDDGAGRLSLQGGRVTELVARPLLSLYWPHLRDIVQPLGGEWAIRRDTFAALPVPVGYGVEMSTMLDVFAEHGAAAIAQVDLGTRGHSHQSVHDLALMAGEILAVAMRRLGQPVPAAAQLRQVDRSGSGTWLTRPVPLTERPPARVLDPPGAAAGLVRRQDATVTDTNPAPVLAVPGQRLVLDRTLIMGVVNASPESFSDGGRTTTAADRVALADELIAAGADIIDVGGQSAVTNQPELEAQEEIDRVLPIVERLVANHPDVLVSVDTYKPPVVAACLDAGAAIINDVSGLAYRETAELCARHHAALVIMHTAGRPKQRLQAADLYDDIVTEVVDFLRERIDEAVSAGVPLESLIVDPGPDFTKTPHQTLELLRELRRVGALGRPVLLALSRKDFLGAILQKTPRGRDAGTLAAITLLAGTVPGGIVRVHDVGAARDVLRTIDALTGRTDIDPDYVLPDYLRYERPV
jgi:dihydropteroate synthase